MIIFSKKVYAAWSNIEKRLLSLLNLLKRKTKQ